MNETRTLKKISENLFRLEVSKNDGKVVTVAKFTKSEMKGNVDAVKRDLNIAMARKSQIEAQLKKINIEDTQELRDMIELIRKAQELDKKAKIEKDLKNLLIEIEAINKQNKELKRAVPEFYRGKK